MIPLQNFVVISGVLFCTGIFVVLTKKNNILILMGIELVFNAANINLIAFGNHNPEMKGQLFVIFVIMIAACEAVVGLAIILNAYRYFFSIDPDKMNDLNG